MDRREPGRDAQTQHIVDSALLKLVGMFQDFAAETLSKLAA
jgi:hypothetical protein